MCFFDDKYFPIATNSFSPFNSQIQFSREALRHYMVIPFIGRMDDIWGGYYLESLGFKVVYTKATVFQDRNIQNLTTNLVNEYVLIYENTLNLLNKLNEDSDNIHKFLPESAKDVLKILRNYYVIILSYNIAQSQILFY